MNREQANAHLVTLGESIIAAVTATISYLVLGVPVWAMFIGWIAFFTRGVDFRHGLISLACVLFGLVFGMAASAAMSSLAPSLGAATLTVVVFTVAVVVLSLRLIPVFNNLLGYFLGLVSYFASHMEPSIEAFAELAVAACLGSLAGWAVSRVPGLVREIGTTTART